ncbi:MAG: MFS transporter [Bryobacteraceae bacterium]|nr:MFS transporter [Bryobacteraceae bacterium]
MLANSKLSGVARALRHRNYQLFFGGQCISLTGTWMQNVAQAWLVYQLSKSSFLLGLVGFVGQFPVFLIAPLAGHVADRWSRHRIIVATQAAMMLLAFALAAITFSGVVQVWHVVVLAALLGVVNAFDMPARQAFVVQMVGRADLTNAIALNSSLFNGARIVGPAIAGLLVAAIGEAWCFFANGVSYIAVIAGLLLMRIEPHVQPPQAESAIAHIIAGFRWVGHTRPIRALLIQLGIVSLAGMPYAVLMPIFADRILHHGATGLGVLLGATGVGALGGALRLALRQGTRGLGRSLAYSTFSFGALLILFAYSRSFWLSAALLVPAGFAFISQMAGTNTLIQSMVPDALRGRVMSVYSMMFMGMAPLGALGAGIAAAHFGAPFTVALGGAGLCFTGAVFFTRWPSLRADAKQLLLAQEVSASRPDENVSGGQLS